jgi:hypothetical protein
MTLNQRCHSKRGMLILELSPATPGSCIHGLPVDQIIAMVCKRNNLYGVMLIVLSLVNDVSASKEAA